MIQKPSVTPVTDSRDCKPKAFGAQQWAEENHPVGGTRATLCRRHCSSNTNKGRHANV